MKNVVGEQLSLFGLKTTGEEKPEVLLEILEICAPSKHLMNQWKDKP